MIVKEVLKSTSNTSEMDFCDKLPRYMEQSKKGVKDDNVLNCSALEGVVSNEFLVSYKQKTCIQLYNDNLASLNEIYLIPPLYGSIQLPKM